MTTTNESGRSVYAALLDAGCSLDSHETDLYVEDTPEARIILAKFGQGYTTFTSQIPPHTQWLDVPFAFSPAWHRRTGDGEHITIERGTRFFCLCANTPETDGFDPCDASGKPIEPTTAAGWNALYCCSRCGRIIDQYTGKVTGRRAA